MGSFCTNCLYDLEATIEPRCPECGRAFDPAARDASTLTSSSVIKWSCHHASILFGDAMADFAHKRNRRAFCRECYADLSAVRLKHNCPTCGKFFEISDRSTYRRSRHALWRIIDRFRHICIWRGVLLAGLPLSFALACFSSQRAVFFGRRGHSIILEGLAANMMGMAWLGAAVALHSRYFWGRVEPTWRFADVGVILGVVMMLVGYGYSLYAAALTIV